MQCLGRKRTLRRCRRRAVKGKWFCHKHRRQPWYFSLGTATVLLAATSGLWVPLVYEDPKITARRENLMGHLNAALLETEKAERELGVRLLSEQMPGHNEAAHGGSITLPRNLTMLRNDLKWRKMLSDPMNERIDFFANSLQQYEQAYVEARGAYAHQPVKIKMMLEEMRAQTKCIKLELRYQRGYLDPETHKLKFDKALREQVVSLVSPEQAEELPEEAKLLKLNFN